MPAKITVPLLAVLIASNAHAAEIDISGKPKAAWHQYAGKRVLVRGQFSAFGKFGAIISARRASVYILPDPQSPLQPIAEGASVSATGVLRFQRAVQTIGAVAGIPDYFYFTRRECKLELRRGRSN